MGEGSEESDDTLVDPLLNLIAIQIVDRTICASKKQKILFRSYWKEINVNQWMTLILDFVMCNARFLKVQYW